MSSENQPSSIDQAAEQTQLQFTVLYGSHSSLLAHCYLLEISGVKILLDCGWDSTFDLSLLEPLERVADKISLVLISHANIEHLGALPYAYKHFKLTAPCYLTSPVLKLGQLALYDAVLNGSAPYSLDDVDVAVGNWKELKYKQPGTVNLQNQEHIIITPHASGRTLGGAVWSIVKDSELSVLYVSDIYQRRERLVDGLDLGPTTSLPRNPTLLIQDTIGLSKLIQHPSTRLEQRDPDLIHAVLDCLRKGGDVLIPVDSCSRVLEILLVLDEEWTKNQLQKSYELVFVTRISSVVDMASSHVEWTSRRLQGQMDDSSKPGAMNPLRFSQVAIVDSFEDAFATANPAFQTRPPRVILCSGVDLERSSFSREVFTREICHRPNCLVLITCESFVNNSVALQLLSQVGAANKIVFMEDERWVDLEGAELVEWQQKQRLLEEERERERETENELVDFERATATEANGQLTGVMDGDVLSSPALMRAGSFPLERAMSIQSQSSHGSLIPDGAFISKTGMDKRSVAAALKAEDQREDMLVFSYVPPLEMESVWDEYGALYDITELLGEEEAKKGGSSNGEIGQSPTDDGHESSTGRSDANSNKINPLAKTMSPDDKEEMGPRKKIQVTIQRQVLCDVKVVDFDGRMSHKDLFDFVDWIRPKKLVVVRSSLRNSEKFAIDCQNKPACFVGLAPAPGECLDIAADSSVVRVRIPDETLMACPPPVQINQLVVQRVRGRMALLSMAGDGTSSNSKKRRRVVVTGGELPSILPVRDGETLPAEDSSECWWVSKKQEPNWGSILDRLNRANIPARMKTDEKSVLLCGTDSDVIIWKPGDGRFLVGGPLCDTYFQVRKLLYSCFALV